MALPSLIYSYNLEIEGVNDIQLPQLQSVSNGFTVSDSGVHKIATPELLFVGGDFNLANNPNLNTLELSGLVNVQGDMSVVNNTDLMNLDGLPTLSSVGGALDLEGSFNQCVVNTGCANSAY